MHLLTLTPTICRVGLLFHSHTHIICMHALKGQFKYEEGHRKKLYLRKVYGRVRARISQHIFHETLFFALPFFPLDPMSLSTFALSLFFLQEK